MMNLNKPQNCGWPTVGNLVLDKDTIFSRYRFHVHFTCLGNKWRPLQNRRSWICPVAIYRHSKELNLDLPIQWKPKMLSIWRSSKAFLVLLSTLEGKVRMSQKFKMSATDTWVFTIFLNSQQTFRSGNV